MYSHDSMAAERFSMYGYGAGLYTSREDMKVLVILPSNRLERDSVMLTSNVPFSNYETILLFKIG